MAQATPSAAPGHDAASMLAVWEDGIGRTLARQGLALLGVLAIDPSTASRLPIGRRDAALLTLHDQLFGPNLPCWTSCSTCGATIEAAFRTDHVRIASAASDQDQAWTVEVETAGTWVRARLPDSADLLAIEHEVDAERAERRLFERCVIEARRDGEAVAAATLSRDVMTAVDAAVTAADPHAEIMLDLACPDCAASILAPFDIVGQVWARLDHWARAMLAAVDALAARYGWSEAQILGLSVARRQAYLDLGAGEAR